MKKLIASLFLWVVSVAPALGATTRDSAFSQLDDIAKGGGFKAIGSDSASTALPVLVGNIIYSALTILGTVFLALMVYAGYLYFTARGNDEFVERAIATIKRSVIGLVIVFLAFAITAFVVGQITTQTGFNTPPSP